MGKACDCTPTRPHTILKTHLWNVARLKHCMVRLPICFCFIRIFFCFFVFALLITLFTSALIKYSIHLYVRLHVAFYKQLHFFLFFIYYYYYYYYYFIFLDDLKSYVFKVTSCLWVA